ncbi:penicillin-binding protein 2 [Candidatus Saccharibacteria bacterium]|nr:penicillin-binding protein 2 [Candidatus Saccharibacteria bacterium]
MVVFGLRLFYIQIIRHDHYRKAALSDQLRQYEIPAERGIIRAQDAGGTVPIVLNQTLYTVFADPTYIEEPEKVADSLAVALGGRAADYVPKLTREGTRYVILAKKVDKDTKNKLLAYKYPGIYAQEQSYRTYPQGSMAAQLLGFVNGEGQGTYGVEEALDSQLAGSPGELKAITDVRGVPLAANTDNISKPAVAGKDVTLTVDVAIQRLVEDAVKAAKEKTKAQNASAVVIDPHTGEIKGMANYPTFNPAKYNEVKDPSVYTNFAVSHPIEIGSTMKTLTTAAALDQGVIGPNTSYYDPAGYTVNGYRITNIEEDGGAGQRDIKDILNLSLNTGATWELMQMGGGNINSKARTAWHNYMVAHYLFGQKTGIEQGYEASGYVPEPKDNGAGINLTYANTAFGQAMTATTLQLGGALSAVVNGGTYYKPHLVQRITDEDGNTTVKKPEVAKQRVVSARTSTEVMSLMEYVVQHHTFYPAFNHKKYLVGGKTGTAQIAKPEGGYYDRQFNGTYVGFVGGKDVQYVIAVFVIKPQLAPGLYAGTAAAQPLFAQIAHGLIDNSFVTPKN